jgi:hypothetical protein
MSIVVVLGATLLSDSIMNPYILSSRIWDSLKRLTPQRARDVSRLLGITLSNAAQIFSNDRSTAWAHATKVKCLFYIYISFYLMATHTHLHTQRWGDHAIQAAVTPQGQTVVQESVATIAKVRYPMQ